MSEGAHRQRTMTISIGTNAVGRSPAICTLLRQRLVSSGRGANRVEDRLVIVHDLGMLLVDPVQARETPDHLRTPRIPMGYWGSHRQALHADSEKASHGYDALSWLLLRVASR